ncbi:P-loop containing nucleoside triphosphate hydrolase [Fusarium albosuccineum]|uniref:P-loop containing nucleoside triphosphate hydrolase n=1 Tax=Fusarium albosuccineum TaxID=1237068 RepID=A0A8H4P5E9_9HYPO|nr:P-loop containing nucleoside triphosphate hydrolase [Fusarium albosuccineum]
METLAALSLAGTVCQFVDFAGKVIRDGKQISISGSSLSVRHLSLVTNDLEKLLSSLKQQFASCSDPNVALSKEDQALLNLAEGCNEVAQALLDGLQKYPNAEAEEKKAEAERQKSKGKTADSGRGPDGEQGKRGLGLRSIRAALGLVWGSKKLGELQDRLNLYREEISLRLLVFLNANQRVQLLALNQLKEGNQEIVEVLLMQCNTLRLKLDQNHVRYSELANTTRQEAEQRHAETIAAILTDREGHSTTIAPKEFSEDGLFKNSVRKNQSFAARTFRGQQADGSFISGNYTDASSIDLTQLTTHILHALEFREMKERQAKVAKAYDDTLKWVYGDPGSTKRPWDSLSKWMESGSGIYWINGKAGSGKSTLMKFINAHQTTLTSLRQWAGNDRLFVGSFFFWYAGTSLQKSQVGLLRSLLFYILQKEKELVPVLFPNVIRALQSKQQALPLELTEVELQSAFFGLVQTDLLLAKVCFIIDGLDEYDGDHDELANTFSQVTQSSKVKILLSSRPIPSCVYAFAKCPSLRLQDLTSKDIRHLAVRELSQHPLMKRLEAAQPGATTELVETIASKSSGVFLWVSVVVKLLIQGLRDYDTVADLRRKLVDLPEELEHLYHHMLRSMSKVNRAQGSRFLQLVLESSKVQGHFPMTPLQLSFAEQEDYGKSFGPQPCALSEEEESWRLESTEGRLRSRCCGLVEVQDLPEVLGTGLSEVRFLHRTVVEFLEDQDNWKEITSWTDGRSFDSVEALLYSSIAELRAKLLPREVEDEPTPFRAVARLLTFEMTMDKRGQILCREKFLPQATRILFSQWGENTGRCRRLQLPPREKLLATAAHNCSKAQLQPLLDACDGLASPSNTKVISRARVAAFLLSEYVDEGGVHARVPIARGIAACQGNPNEAISFGYARARWESRYKFAKDAHASSWSLWGFLLHYVRELMASDFARFLDKGLLDTLFDILIALLEEGAERNTTIDWAIRKAGGEFGIPGSLGAKAIKNRKIVHLSDKSLSQGKLQKLYELD